MLYIVKVERERAKESLEFKRKNDHLHKIVDEEKEDNKRKLIEVMIVLQLTLPILLFYYYICARITEIFSLKAAMRSDGVARCSCKIKDQQ